MDQTEFRQWVRFALDEGIRLTQEFEVPKWLVKEWASGVQTPQPLMQCLIVRYIKKKLEQREAKKEPLTGQMG
jgi:hypothetical protein